MTAFFLLSSASATCTPPPSDTFQHVRFLSYAGECTSALCEGYDLSCRLAPWSHSVSIRKRFDPHGFSNVWGCQDGYAGPHTLDTYSSSNEKKASACGIKHFSYPHSLCGNTTNLLTKKCQANKPASRRLLSPLTSGFVLIFQKKQAKKSWPSTETRILFFSFLFLGIRNGFEWDPFCCLFC